MKKNKKWHSFVIVTALLLTIYNILPTIFYYSKPLKSPIDQYQGQKIGKTLIQNIDNVQKDSKRWLHSFCRHLGIQEKSIIRSKDTPSQFILSFTSPDEAKLFRQYLPKAGLLRPFAPSRLFLSPIETDPKTVYVQSAIFLDGDKSDTSFFNFGKKFQEDRNFTPFYQKIIDERVGSITYAIMGKNSYTSILQSIGEKKLDPKSYKEQVLQLAEHIALHSLLFKKNPTITKRFFANLWQALPETSTNYYTRFLDAITHVKDEIKKEIIEIKKGINTENPEENTENILSELESKEMLLIRTKSTIEAHKNFLSSLSLSMSPSQAKEIVHNAKNQDGALQTISFINMHPFLKSLEVDSANSKIIFHLHPDIMAAKNESSPEEKEQLEQLIFQEITEIAQKTGEPIKADGPFFTLSLEKMQGVQSFIQLDLANIAKNYSSTLAQTLQKSWKPQHPELQKKSFPIVDWKTYPLLSMEQKSLCLVIGSTNNIQEFSSLEKGSIYIIAKGLQKICHKYENESSEDFQIIVKDLESLQKILHPFGFVSYPGQHLTEKNFKEDFIFEKTHYYQSTLDATRENLYVKGDKEYAILEFTDIEQRILKQNQIDTEIHEDLLKAKDEYQSAQVSSDPTTKFSTPPVDKNLFFHNLHLSLRKYFRGDERKVLHWGLDLSGGKSVSIELRDQNNKRVDSQDELKQGMNELYTRVNKMGVSEVNIRLEGTKILLDFPGSQGLSAKELIKASSMYFHVVNEKFSPYNNFLAPHIHNFLQQVWNEALLLHRTDMESINEIACNHLYGEQKDERSARPKSESAKILLKNGLRLSSLHEEDATSSFNDSLSKIAIFREDSLPKWAEQTHPLLIVFRNYALDGTGLTNIRSSYDPSKGNFLSFEVKKAIVFPDGGKTNPQLDFNAWTSQFCKESIQNTPNEKFSHGKGWRMAVILNDTIVSAPTLESSLKNSAMISGSFSQREANQLAADLKAGSLSFTPKILSEKNISPELGKQDRIKSIIATVFALCLVIVTMVTYYRFAGVIASAALLFNLLIMWAALQNIQAVLSLSGIAGIILTLGMAVDANVLVFERIREESLKGSSLSMAIFAGYKKAFSAILDSNVTTIIAALILLNFDAGPIKGFALTLIIGIASSMFTSLFMTKFFFSIWLKNSPNKTLQMRYWIKSSSFNFLKSTKFVVALSTLLILAGGYSLVQHRDTLFGMDFTGGHSIQLELTPTQEENYREKVEKALLAQGASLQEFSIRELAPANILRILLSPTVKNFDTSFASTPSEKKAASSHLSIDWIIDSLQKAEIEISPSNIEKIQESFSQVSGQMSQNMRKSAAWGLFFAMMAILIYIAVRFEWKYSFSALFCLFHDVVVSVGCIALLHGFGINVQIDLHTIAALMTIIGYSLNDTIIIFDRIREDISQGKKLSFSDVVNQALNTTLSRTLMTSITTMIVLVVLVALGGSSIFSFSLVMCIGVIFGTLSSLFIASPLMLLLHRLEIRRGKRVMHT